MILTSNQSFGAWGEVFGDRVIATAILDRLLHHAVTLNIRGNSYRLKEKLKAGLVRSDDDNSTVLKCHNRVGKQLAASLQLASPAQRDRWPRAYVPAS
jgi:hypothetical protein